MGNKNTKPIASFSDWQKVQTQNEIQIYRNKKNNEQAEKRSVTIDPHYDLEDELKIYHMRQNNNDALVRAFGAEEVQKKSQGEGICSGHKKLQVLTQKMPYRLSQLPQLTFPQSLLFLRESLRAYYRVFKSYGPIHVTKKLIGINQFGEVKSWVNENWALNHPNNDLPTLQSTKLQGFSSRSTEAGPSSETYDAKYRDETEMVYNIVAVIEQKCEEGKFPKAFSEQVEQHSGSFRKLSSYVQDFIRVNELFIPPKINYETVFVWKYQVRLAEQHQQAGQLIARQSEAIQNQKMLTVTGGGYTTATGEYRGESVSGQSLGYSRNVGQGQEGGSGGYTVTKNTTTTYGNTISPLTGMNNATSYSSTYEPFSFQPVTSFQKSYQPSLPSLTSTPTLPTETIPFQKTQSIYKLPQQNPSTYSSSYYQYSATNPSSIGMNSYKFGTSTGEYTSGDTYKPLSYNSALGNSSGLQLNGTTQGYSATGNQNAFTFTSLDQRFATSQNDNPLSPYQNLPPFSNDRKIDFQTFTNATPIKQSYEQFKKSFSQIGQTTTTNPTTFGYSTTTYGTKHNYEPLISDSAQKGSTFSFDGRNDFTTKFNEFAGKGYSNSLASYEKTTDNVTGGQGDGAIVGKYASEFSGLLGPFMGLKNQYEAEKSAQGLVTNQGLTVNQNSSEKHA